MKSYKYILLLLFLLIGLGSLLFFTLHEKIDTDLSKALKTPIINFPKKQVNTLSTQSQIKQVFVIVEENHDWETIYNNSEAPYVNNILVKQGAYASNYRNVPTALGELHPSELNYIFLEAGMITFPDHTFENDDSPNETNSTASTDHLVTLLEKKGYTWKSYQEGIDGSDCPIHTNNDYAPKHNPMIFFQDVSGNPPDTNNQYCNEHIRPFSELQKDLASGNVPNYVFITPNLQHDMHNGSIADADNWLSQIVPQITNSQTFKKDGALFITWDEGSESNDSNNPIGMIILSPFAKSGYTNNIAYSHASLLKTIQEIFHVTPLLGYANDPQTQDLSDFFQK